MENEVWKDVVRYEGSYQVSNLGRIKSFMKHPYGIVLKPRVTKKKGKNYHAIMLCSGKRKTQKAAYIHRLVWESFNGEIPNGYEVNHIDGNKENPRLDNLELVTRAGNM